MVISILLLLVGILPILAVIFLVGYAISSLMEIKPWVHEAYEDFDIDKEYDEYLASTLLDG